MRLSVDKITALMVYARKSVSQGSAHLECSIATNRMFLFTIFTCKNMFLFLHVLTIVKRLYTKPNQRFRSFPKPLRSVGTEFLVRHKSIAGPFFQLAVEVGYL